MGSAMMVLDERKKYSSNFIEEDRNMIQHNKAVYALKPDCFLRG